MPSLLCEGPLSGADVSRFSQAFETAFYFDLSRLGNVSVKRETKEELKRVIQLYYDEYWEFF